MQSRPESGNLVEPDVHGSQPSTIGSQPWWLGVGYSAVSPTILPESASKSPQLDLSDGGEGTKSDQSQPEDDGDENGDASKGMQNMATEAGSDASYGQEHQHLQHITSAMPPVIAEYILPHTQLELGHSVACAPYPYSDPYYGGIMAAYGTQALVHPHLLGMSHTRMPLPLEMAEEPVYVNAKQYNGILRRRQSRAKAELEKKLIKARKPYLHESRHQHAMRRARGCGGRFLNTKNADGNATHPTSEKVACAGSAVPMQPASSPGSEPRPSDCLGNSIIAQEVKDPTMQDMPEWRTCINRNGSYQQHAGFQLSVFHSFSGDRGVEGDCSGKQRSGILVNWPLNQIVAIQ